MLCISTVCFQFFALMHLNKPAYCFGSQSVDELYERDYSLIYTTDPNMASHKGEDKLPVQVSQNNNNTVKFT